MVAMIDRWKDPVYVTRIWTMFEQYTATKLNVPVTMIMPPEETKSFNNEINRGEAGFATVKASLTNIDVENCEASEESDLIKVKGLIQSSVGFKAVNTSVKGSMAKWCATQVQGMFT